ncbi:MAG: hypothetical protein EG828_14740, partial [Deltaproteobacteria bacterium]|nr:hypothetical protein [Deltaproteobacteria bacterium]
MIILILVLVLIIALLAGLLIRQRSTAVSTQKALTEHVVFEEILEKLSRTFVNIPPEKVDDAIDEAIKMVCDRMDFDIAALWEWTDDEKRYLTITHLYRPLGGPPVPSEINGYDTFPWCIGEFNAGRIVAVSTDDLP